MRPASTSTPPTRPARSCSWTSSSPTPRRSWPSTAVSRPTWTLRAARCRRSTTAAGSAWSSWWTTRRRGRAPTPSSCRTQACRCRRARPLPYPRSTNRRSLPIGARAWVGCSHPGPARAPTDGAHGMDVEPGSTRERVWDRFLTEADRAHMAASKQRPPYGFGQRPAIVAIGATKNDDDGLRRRYEIVEQAAPVPGEVVLRKTAPSAFFGTPLMSHYNSLGIDTLIVCGESTSGCVRASVIDARSYRFNVIVVEECVYDRHEASHAMNLFDMNQKYADVLPLNDVVTYLDKLRADLPNG